MFFKDVIGTFAKFLFKIFDRVKTMGCCLSEFSEGFPILSKESKRRKSSDTSERDRNWRKSRRKSSTDDGK